MFINPKTDFAFKKIFGSPQSTNILISFLNAILYEGKPTIQSLTIIDPYQAPRIEQQREIAKEIDDLPAQANALGALGNVYFSKGQYTATLGFHQQHLAIAQVLGLRRSCLHAIGNIGNVHNATGDYAQASDCYQQQLTLAQAIALGNLGVVAYEQDNYAEALVLMTQQLEIAREIGDRTREAQALGNLRNVPL